MQELTLEENTSKGLPAGSYTVQRPAGGNCQWRITWKRDVSGKKQKEAWVWDAADEDHIHSTWEMAMTM